MASSVCLLRPGVGRAAMPNSCLLPPVHLAVSGTTVAWCGCDTLPFPHCRTHSTQDDTSSELPRGAPSDGGEQPAASAFQGRQALARYCVCHQPGVSLSLLCLALTLGTCVGSGSSPAAGTNACECCSACPGAHGEGCRRAWLHHLWGPRKAWELLSLTGSLTLPQSPTLS